MNYRILLLTALMSTSISYTITAEEQQEIYAQTIVKGTENIGPAIEDLKEHITEVFAGIMTTLGQSTVSDATKEQLQAILKDVATQLKNAYDLYMVSIASISKRVQSEALTPEDLATMSTSYKRHLEFFAEELQILLKILLPLKDCDTMTEEEIKQALTV